MALNQLFTNNAKAKLASSITNSQTNLTVTTGLGSLFPNPTGSQFFLATIKEVGVGIEIIKVTTRSTDSFSTIVRAQEGTSGLAFSTNAEIYLSITGETFQDINDRAIQNIDNTGNTLGAGAIDIQTGRTNPTRIASGEKSIAIGNNAKTANPYSIALGYLSEALGNYSIAIGPGIAKNDFTISFNGGWNRISAPMIQSVYTLGESSAYALGMYAQEQQTYCGISTRFVTEPIDLCGGTTWGTTTTYEHGKYIKPTVPNGKMYARYDFSYPADDSIAYTPSTGGTVEPTWPTIMLETVVDDNGHGSYFCIDPANYAIAFAGKFVCEGIDILVYNISGVTDQATIDIGTQANGTLLKSAHTTNLTSQWQLEKIAITPHAIDDLKINITTMATGTELLVRFVVHGYYVKHWL